MTRKVFIVDDDAVYQLILKKLIAKIDEQVVIESFKNGAPAVDAVKNIISSGGDLPEVMFLDINMPVMDGWQFLDALAEINDPLLENRIYMMSTSLDNRDKEQAGSRKLIKEYVFKPVTPDKLAQIITGN